MQPWEHLNRHNVSWLLNLAGRTSICWTTAMLVSGTFLQFSHTSASYEKSWYDAVSQQVILPVGWFRTVIAVSTLAWMLNESNLSWVFIQLFLQISAILCVYNVIQTFGTVFAQLQRWVNTQKRWIAILKSICSSSQPSTMVPAIFLSNLHIFESFLPKDQNS